MRAVNCRCSWYWLIVIKAPAKHVSVILGLFEAGDDMSVATL